MEPRAATLAKAWLFHVEIAAWLVALGAALAGAPGWAGASAAAGLAAHAAGRLWSRRSPVPMPYSMRWVLLVPRGPHSPARVQRLLQPRSGERVLEIGPGVGIHALLTATSLAPHGVLDVLDVQHEMLGELMRRAAQRGVRNIAPCRGDAQRLPYPDGRFDAGYLISVLGEIPDAPRALGELWRVLRPGARLLVAEIAIDPDFVSLPSLRALAGAAGFAFERSSGPRFAYSALFRRAGEAV